MSQKTCQLHNSLLSSGSATKNAGNFSVLKVYVYSQLRGSYVILACMVLVCIPATIFAQDTMALNTVEIISLKNDLSKLGKKTETVDSIVRLNNRFSSLADLLSLNSGVFIKSYGPGALSTTAFRGGSAAQTAILWNGLNIQNNMLGQTDLSIIPSFLFNQVEIEYGSSSSMWGSGAVGGSIHLNNKTWFSKGFTTQLSSSAGSMGNKSIAAGFIWSGKKFISSTQVYDIESRNNYSYKSLFDITQTIKKLQHAAYAFKGLMQEFKWMPDNHHLLSLNIWVNNNSRQLPSFVNEANVRTDQFDAAQRLSANWMYTKGRYKSVLRVGALNDVIHYNDRVENVYTKSSVTTLLVEQENYVNWKQNATFNWGFHASHYSANSSNYSKKQQLSRAALMIGNKFSFKQQKVLLYLSARAEYFSLGTLPITGNVSLEYKVTSLITLGINGGRIYRQPTLNELFWMPGGNPKLKAEQGYSTEGNAEYKKHINRIDFFFSASVYSRMINNWILWLPGNNGNSSPKNIQQVWSRGSETNTKFSFKQNNFFFGISAMSSYVVSTIEKDEQENSNTIHRQLIYTPRYNLSGTAFIGYKTCRLFFQHQYIGYRFTSSDNLQWLKPYNVALLKLNYTLNYNQGAIDFFVALNNVYNTSYTIISFRPMPLTNYEFGITLHTKPKPKKN